MNLDDFASFAATDPSNMLAHIDGLPDQLQNAWELGSRLELPSWTGIRQVLVAGLGGSAIGADLLAAYVAARCPLPVTVHRDYDLPAWATGPETLVIASSHSGNTEETLASFQAALTSRCRLLAVTTGGELASRASAAGVPLWRFDHRGQPRTAVGYSFGLLLAVLARLGLLPDPSQELAGAVQAMRLAQATLRADVPAIRNLAKRIAGQMVGRYPVIFGAGLLAPVARRWKGQISENAKAWAQFEFIPEANHNTLAGLLQPEAQLEKLLVIFLRSPSDHPRNFLRSELMRKVCMLEGLNTDYIDASGDSPLAHQWTTLHMGDYISYYLAMAYAVDPTQVSVLEAFKQEMKAAAG